LKDFIVVFVAITDPLVKGEENGFGGADDLIVFEDLVGGAEGGEFFLEDF